jgi:ankyrin repeat protein
VFAWLTLAGLQSSVDAAAPPTASQLIDAVKSADADAVARLLAQGADGRAVEADGTSALHWAVHRDDPALIKLLIAAGADVQAANRYDVTPLKLATINRSAAAAEILLEAGANANSTSAEGETVLMAAARTGSPDLVRVLLARGADVNAKENWRGQTALMWAISEKHLPVVQLLVEAGAEVKAKSTKGFTPFLFAVRGGDFAIVRALLAAGADANETAGDGTTALAVAIVNAHYELAALLLDHGADPNTDMPGGTALHAVTRTRNYEYGTVVRPAAEQTGSLDALDLVKLLLARGANPNAQIVKPLPRQGGFDNNYLRLGGATPFLIAARSGDHTLMRLLAEHGADPALPTTENVTPLMVAAGAGYVQGQSIAAPADRLEAVKLLLEFGADIHATTKTGETAMHGAATGGVAEIVELLAARGALLDAKDKDGTTPLAIADGTKSNFRRWPHIAELLQRLMASSQQ